MAPKTWELYLGVYNKLEDKASSTLTWISGAAGLMAGGVTLAVADQKMQPDVARCFVPAVLLAVVAGLYAVLARRGRCVFPRPSVRTAMEWERYYPKGGEVKILSEWHKANASMELAVSRRSRQTSRALMIGFAAMAALVLPLLYVAFFTVPSAR